MTFIRKVHIPNTNRFIKGSIPLRAKEVIDDTTGIIKQEVSKPHYKGSFIDKANKLLAEGKIDRNTFVRMVDGFFN